MRALFCASTKWCASAASKPPPSAVPSIMASEIAPVSKPRLAACTQSTQARA